MAHLLTLLSWLLVPLLAVGLRLRGEPAARTAERLARGSLAKMEQAENTKATDAPEVLWFHGASVGEVRALLPLVLHYANRSEACEGVLLTVQSAQGYAVATQALDGQPRVAVAMAPMDHPGVMARFCAHHRLRGLVLYENELWPGWLAALRARGVPVVLLDASLSARSLRFWRRWPGLTASVGAGLSRVTAADSGQRQALDALGWGPVHQTPPLKLVGSALPVDPAELARWRHWRRKGAPLLVFANVHPGEIRAVEGMIAGWMALVAGTAGSVRTDTDRADVQIIVAPRHPEKLARFRQALGGEGPGFAYWTGFGTLGTLYALGGIVVIGGGFDAKVGSHNPMEALRAGCVTVCGPHSGKQAALIALLEAEGLIAHWAELTSAGDVGVEAQFTAPQIRLKALAQHAETSSQATIDEAIFGCSPED